MVDGILQCCYTNATNNVGGTQTSGWKTVACSEGIPADALEGCTRYQRGNSNIRKAMVDENGNDLNLLEIAGDGKYLYVIRTKYGLTDAAGRRNMFSHGYIFRWDDKRTSDPNYFLTIRKSNFAENEKVALIKWGGFTRGDSLNIPCALKDAGLDSSNKLSDLIAAVYEQMTNQGIFEPLYVQYDGTEKELRATLYCIYTFLPPYLRYRLVCASAEGNNSSITNVIFTQNAARHRFYFDAKGDTSLVLTKQRKLAIGRLGFVEHAAKNSKEDPQKFYQKLEEKAESLKAVSKAPAQVTLLYKIAYQLIMDGNVAGYDADKLDRSLDEALRLRTHGSEEYDEYLAKLLGEFANPDRKIKLDQTTEQDLRDRLLDTDSEVLSQAIEQYDMYVMSILSVEGAAERLCELANTDKVQFERYKTLLSSDAYTELFPASLKRKMLDECYVKLLSRNEKRSWEYLKEILVESLSLGQDCPKTEEEVRNAAWELYCTKISNISDAPDALEAYMEVMRYITSEIDTQDYWRGALKKFWDDVKPENLDLEHVDAYRKMDDSTDRASNILEVLDLCDSLVNASEDEYLRKFHTYCIAHSLTYNADERRRVLKLFGKYAKDDRPDTDARQATNLDKWMHLVSLIESRESLIMLLQIREALGVVDLTQDDCVVLTNRFNDYAAALNGETNEVQAVLNSFRLFENMCVRIDKTSHEPIPLDVWLTIGGFLYKGQMGGAFVIFNPKSEYKQRILFIDAFDVVVSSRFIGNPRSLGYAKQYLDRLRRTREHKTLEWRAINAWVKEEESIAKEWDEQDGLDAQEDEGDIYEEENDGSETVSLLQVITGLLQHFKHW